jgi:hypothetical protein
MRQAYNIDFSRTSKVRRSLTLDLIVGLQSALTWPSFPQGKRILERSEK